MLDQNSDFDVAGAALRVEEHIIALEVWPIRHLMVPSGIYSRNFVTNPGLWRESTKCIVLSL